ncbi:MAG: hypothetical protein H6581_28235 [Bacteroidia bacterium]|nr:hypothetical protein [Bacteroidia bacterium]
MNHPEKSLEQLENDFWPDQENYVSGLVRRCHEYRKIPLGELTSDQLRTLLGQKIGLNFILEPSIQYLEANILDDADLYEGCLLENVLLTESAIWEARPDLKARLRLLTEGQRETLLAEFGPEEFARILEKLP